MNVTENNAEPTAAELRGLVQFKDGSVSRLNRRVYTDRQIFDLEMRHIWEKTWIFIAHESQLPTPGDYVTTLMGRQPVFAMRGKSGEIGVFMNACSHRGATICRIKRGHARAMVCPYHGWSFDIQGALLAPKEASTGAYPPDFDKADLGLKRAARVEIYKGFVFASLAQDVLDLKVHLGDAATIIDMIADQGTSLEILKGVCSYTYEGNWKLQAENGVDGYHPSTVHMNFIATQKRRLQADGGQRPVGMTPVTNASKAAGGYFDFGRGNTMIWGDWSNPEDRFNYRRMPEFIERMGEVKAAWAIGRLRNLYLYPSAFLMDQQSSQIRIIQPISVSKTKVIVYCVAPVGEDPTERSQRIRYYEDFFNASGMATPDDLSEFASSQTGFAAQALPMSDLSRGAMHQVKGANSYAESLGVSPVSSGAWIGDEGVFHGQYEHWLALLTAGVDGERHARG